MTKNKKIILLMILTMIVIFTAGCGKDEQKKQPGLINGSKLTPMAQKETNASNVTSEGIIFHGVLMSIDTTEKTMIIVDIDDGNRYKFTYTGGTDIRNRYKETIAASQVKVGKIYEFVCDGDGGAKRMSEWDKQWTAENISRFEMDSDNGVMTVGTTSYSLAGHALILSDGEEILPEEIVNVDKISVYGKDKTIYAVIVEQGHGYIELTGVNAFLDGYVTVAGSIVMRIELNMVITAPEGSYNIVLQKGSQTAESAVTVERGQTITADFSQYEPESVRTGTVKLNITPSNAVLMVDGAVKDHSRLFNLDYGTHNVVIIADGYEKYSGRLVIGTEYFTQDISLAENSTAASESSSDSSNTDGYVIKINGPSGAAVYIDNVYVGIAPLSIKKSAGTKVVTLTKTGYTSRSYTINIANTAGNVEYTFPEMEKSGN